MRLKNGTQNDPVCTQGHSLFHVLPAVGGGADTGKTFGTGSQGREGGERKVKIGAADLSGDLYPGMDEKRNLFLCRIFADCLHLPGEEQIVPVRQIPFTKDQ